MKAKILFVTALLAVSSITSADTLSNLLNDIPKNVSFVEQTGNCDMNVEHVTDNSGSYSWKPIDDRCEPVVALCGKGKTILPSSCEVTYSDGTKLPNWGTEKEISKTDFVNGSLTCNVELPYQYPAMEGRTTRDVTIKATARCVKTPANLIQNTAKKLGITIK